MAPFHVRCPHLSTDLFPPEFWKGYAYASNNISFSHRGGSSISATANSGPAEEDEARGHDYALPPA